MLCVRVILIAIFLSCVQKQAAGDDKGTSKVGSIRQPHIIHLLVDDLGWGELGYHNPEAGDDIRTPHFDKLAQTGLQLDRLYGEKICSPSRSAFQTGRLGIHVNVVNVFPEVNNPRDPVGGYQGIPVNMTGIAEVLKGAGYATHLVGKWDVGMATEEHSPWARGYDTWLGYWHHSNDYWTQEQSPTCEAQAVRDLWRHNGTYSGPAMELQNGPDCSQQNQHPTTDAGGRDAHDSVPERMREEEEERCVYEEDVLLAEAKRVILDHHNRQQQQQAAVSNKLSVQAEEREEAESGESDSYEPLFMVYSTHLVHMPLQIKEELLEEFSYIDQVYRRHMHAMVSQLDANIGEIVDLLHETGMWEDTLLVVHSDNGGEIMAQYCGGNNWPLRGGKFSNFEGGVRVNGIASGGWLLNQQPAAGMDTGTSSLSSATTTRTRTTTAARTTGARTTGAGVPPRLPENGAGGSAGSGGGAGGRVVTGLMSVADWYSTYAAAAGLDVSKLVDEKARLAELPAIDSVNCLPLLLGQSAECRLELPLGDQSSWRFDGDGDALVGGIITSDGFKLLLGAENKGFKIDQDVVTAPIWPNTTLPPLVPELHPRVCDRSKENGCLFDIWEDPSESSNLLTAVPQQQQQDRRQYAEEHGDYNEKQKLFTSYYAYRDALAGRRSVQDIITSTDTATSSSDAFDPTTTISPHNSTMLLFDYLLSRIDFWQSTVYSPRRGTKDPAACEQAIANWYYWGPWLK